jgi:hypothetical protein
MIDPSDTSELLAWMPRETLPKEYGGEGELLPIAAACRRYRLPPFDGRMDPSADPSAAGSEAQGDAQLLVPDDAEEVWHEAKEGVEVGGAAQRVAA